MKPVQVPTIAQVRKLVAEDVPPICSQSKLHAKDAPEGYLAWHEWAEKKAKTHDQSQCPGCGRWKVWTKRSRVSQERAGDT